MRFRSQYENVIDEIVGVLQKNKMSLSDSEVLFKRILEIEKTKYCIGEID